VSSLAAKVGKEIVAVSNRLEDKTENNILVGILIFS
jgi:hypothetical protein